MIAFDLAYELTLGVICARTSRLATRGLVVSALVYVPICVGSLVAWSGWQGMYLADLDGRVALAWASAIQAFALFVAYGAGVWIGRRRTPSLRSVAAAWVALLLVLLVALHERAFTVTSYAAFHAGERPPLIGGPVMWFLIASGAVNGLALLALRMERRPTPP